MLLFAVANSPPAVGGSLPEIKLSVLKGSAENKYLDLRFFGFGTSRSRRSRPNLLLSTSGAAVFPASTVGVRHGKQEAFLELSPYIKLLLTKSPNCVTKNRKIARVQSMSDLVRFGVSLEKTLLNKFDTLINEKKYTNRSEALRDLIRQELVQKQWQGGREVAGAITLIYDHHKKDVLSKVTDIQHDFQNVIISTQHIHLDHHNCLEIVAVKGKARDIERLSDMVKAIKGVRHGTLSMSSCGSDV